MTMALSDEPKKKNVTTLTRSLLTLSLGVETNFRALSVLWSSTYPRVY